MLNDKDRKEAPLQGLYKDVIVEPETAVAPNSNEMTAVSKQKGVQTDFDTQNQDMPSFLENKTVFSEKEDTLKANNEKTVIIDTDAELCSEKSLVPPPTVIHLLPHLNPIKKDDSENDRQKTENVRPVRSQISSIRFPNGIKHKPYRYELAFDELISGVPSGRILDVGLNNNDMGLQVSITENKIILLGTPTEKGNLHVWVEYTMGVDGDNAKKLREDFPAITVFPDPKSLWKNLPVDITAPYQVPNEKSFSQFGLDGKGIVAASKRGRSHAHDGKFRDDDFCFEWISETRWLVVAVSDGAGSAEFSREGARIACSTFVDELREKLSSNETNRKIEAIPEKHGQELALERLLLETAHHGAKNIQDVAKTKGIPAKKYSTTFLGYIAKKIGDEWIIVSIGIGDGAIALVDIDDNLFLLNEPDGGEYVGQTRFITNPEVWQDSCKRTFSVRVKDFKYLFSMTDGVSDPKFETDNNLKNLGKWKQLWDDLQHSVDAPVHFERRDNKLQEELLSWLDFWSKGNHDDRTLTILY